MATLAAFGRFVYNTHITSDKERAFTMANMTISVNDNTKREFTKFNVPIRAVRDDIAGLESDIEISRREFAEGKGIPLDVAAHNMLAAIHEHAERRCALGQYPAQT